MRLRRWSIVRVDAWNDGKHTVYAEMRATDEGAWLSRAEALAALRAELPTFSCYEPARLIGTPCSCVVGMARAIEIVEGMA